MIMTFSRPYKIAIGNVKVNAINTAFVKAYLKVHAQVNNIAKLICMAR